MDKIKLVPKNKINLLLEELKDDLKALYGDHLKALIIYGSYARGIMM